MPAAEPAGAPGVALLSAEEKDLFVEAFHKELDFLELVLLLVNRSFPFKNVDLIWASEARSGRVTAWQGTGATRALRNPHLRLLSGPRRNPDPRFCNLINDYGRREAETCLLSDLAAAERARRTGRVQVYTCHAGITDVAVPVRSGPHYLATLHCGQCLREPPSESGFARIARRAARLQHVDLDELRKAYYELPVIPPERVRNATRLLSLFAESLGRLWERLRDAVRFQRHKLREADLLRLEFAHLMLSGGGRSDRERIRALLRQLGFRHSPNRVIVVQPESESDLPPSWSSYEVARTAVWHAVESVAEKMDDAAAVHLRPHGICLFWHDSTAQSEQPAEFRARRLAQRIVHAVNDRCGLSVRVGVGPLVKSWRRLGESYQGARDALAGSEDPVVFYRPANLPIRVLRDETDDICRRLDHGDWDGADQRLRGFPVLVFRHLGAKPEAMPAARHMLNFTLELIADAAQRLGCDELSLCRLRQDAARELEAAASRVALEEAWERCCAGVLEQVRRLHLGKHEKLVERARRMLDWGVEHPTPSKPLSLESVAASLGVSAGHLSRSFSRIMGVSFRRYLVEKRLERARRLLLDPVYNVSQVAEACGYPNTGYFIRAFRKAVGCTPGQFARRPFRVTS